MRKGPGKRRGCGREVVLGEGPVERRGCGREVVLGEGMWKGRGVRGGAVERRVVEGEGC